ncbi:MAG: hypothetical protein [Bacteriophage sp.]|nr:MAG: hypothetical protein [Bacteriophage sp.]
MIEKISTKLGKLIGLLFVAVLLVVAVGGLAMGLAVLITGFKFLWSAVVL